MAELKWTNVNDSGANTAFSNYLDANKSFRKSIMGIGETLSDFTNTLKKGDAENNQRIRDDVTNSILNRANGIQSQEDMDKYLASGALDNDPLRQQYGWFVNMDKVNEAKANLPKDVLNRAIDVDSSKAYNEKAHELQNQLNEALGRGDNAAAQKIQKELSNITSLASSSANAKNIYQLTKDIDDRDLHSLEWDFKAGEALNNATNTQIEANYNIQAFYNTLTPLLTDSNGKSLLYNEDGSTKPITLDLINQSSLDAPAKAQYSAQLVKLQQAVLQATANRTQAQAFMDNVRQHFGKKATDSQVPESDVQSILKQIQNFSPNQSQNSSDSSGNSSNSSDNSSDSAANNVIDRANSFQNNQSNTNESEKSVSLPEVYGKEAGKPVEELTGEELVAAILKVQEKRKNQQDASEITSETNNGRLNGVNKTMATIRGWNDSNRPASYEAFRASLSGEDLKAFDQANALTGGKLAEYAQASISGADASAWENAYKEYEYYIDLAKNNKAMSYLTAKLDKNTDPATLSYLASVLSTPKQITETVNGEPVTLTSDSSEHSIIANKANLDKILASWYAKQGWIDGSNTNKWIPDLGWFRKIVNDSISNGVDPIAIYSVIKNMDSRANGEEVDAGEFRSVMDILNKEKDNLASWKDDFYTKNKNLTDLKNNETQKLLFAHQALPMIKLGNLPKDKALAIFVNLNSDIKGYLGDAAQTEDNKQESELLIKQIQNWANGITPTDTQKLSQDIENNAYGSGFGDNVMQNYNAEAVKKRAKQVEERLNKVRNQVLPKELREAIIRLSEIGTPSQLKKIYEIFGIKG